MSSPDVRSFTVGPVQENCYLVRADSASTRALIVDPGEEHERLLAGARALGVEIEAILITHCHFDHIGAVAPVARATGAPVYCPEIGEHASLDLRAVHGGPRGPRHAGDRADVVKVAVGYEDRLDLHAQRASAGEQPLVLLAGIDDQRARARAVGAHQVAVLLDRADGEGADVGAFYRAMAAAALFLLASLLLFKKSAPIALFPIVLLMYLPISYYTDLWMFRRRQRNRARRTGGKAASR